MHADIYMNKHKLYIIVKSTNFSSTNKFHS